RMRMRCSLAPIAIAWNWRGITASGRSPSPPSPRAPTAFRLTAPRRSLLRLPPTSWASANCQNVSSSLASVRTPWRRIGKNWLSCKPALLPAIQRVSRRAHGADQVVILGTVERLAQPADMHIHGARLHIDVVAPHRVQQLFAVEHPALMLQQMAQQAE